MSEIWFDPRLSVVISPILSAILWAAIVYEDFRS